MLPKAALRIEVQKHARSFCGDPFRHHGRSHSGVDCIGLLLCVGEDLGLVDRAGRPFLRADYMSYGLNPPASDFEKYCRERMNEKAIIALEPGDAAIFRGPMESRFFGLVTRLGPELGVVRADRFLYRRVVEHRIDGIWRRRLMLGFDLPDQP